MRPCYDSTEIDRRDNRKRLGDITSMRPCYDSTEIMPSVIIQTHPE